nr:hypothetical protein [Parerythrobacter lutipelagi]
MTRFAHNSLAAFAAVFIVIATWAPVITVPAAEAATFAMPALA